MLDIHRESGARAPSELRWPAVRLGLRESVEQLHPPRLDPIAGIEHGHTQAGIAKRLRRRDAGGTRADHHRRHERGDAGVPL
jgi:hypothetical protein